MMLGLVAVGILGCRPSDVLSVPAPAGVLSDAALRNQTGAEGAFNAARAQLFEAADGYYAFGLLMWSGLLTDEFTFSGFSLDAVYANVDARSTTGSNGYQEGADNAWEFLLQARSALLLAVPNLARYEPASELSKIGEAYALAGYATLLVAESYCAGTPLDEVRPGGSIQYGTPLSTDSLLGVAQTYFDSAVANAHGEAMVAGLASVGAGRILLDRGQYAAAARVVANVPTSFAYGVVLEPSDAVGATQLPSLYAYGVEYNSFLVFNVAEGKGENGLNFVSAHDPRLMLDTTSYRTLDGSAWRLPTKFETNLSTIPLATGIEARLVEAEAALRAGALTSWLTDLNALRNSGCTIAGADTTCALGTGQVAGQTVGLPSLADPGTDSARVSLTFRERAFWLFGTGSRLGDMRRLVRQYGRDQSTVFPIGQYPNGHNPALPTPILNYGTDVNLTLPTPYGLSSNGISETNPSYKGCLSSTKTP